MYGYNGNLLCTILLFSTHRHTLEVEVEDAHSTIDDRVVKKESEG